MANEKELKDIIVELKVQVAQMTVPHGNCPYAYFSGIKREGECGDVSCYVCKDNFYATYKKLIEKEVESL